MSDRASLGALTQVRTALAEVFAMALVNVLVLIQSHRWFRDSRSHAALRWVRSLARFLLLLELVHIILLGIKLDIILSAYAGVEVQPAKLRPSLLDQRLELFARWCFVVIAGTVQSTFTWRAYKITKKVWMRALLASLALCLFVFSFLLMGMFTYSLRKHQTLGSPANKIVRVVFSWASITQNVALAWVFYKELIVDRIAGAQAQDPVIAFAVEALSHQAPLIAITFGASIAVSVDTAVGFLVNELFFHLYAPVCLLSAFTALLSHHQFRQRFNSSQDADKLEHARSIGNTRQHSTKRQRNTRTENPSFWRADSSRVSHHDLCQLDLNQIKVEQSVSRVVECEQRSPDEDYFNFDLTALERATPASMRPKVRFGAQTMPAFGLDRPALGTVAVALDMGGHSQA